MIDFFNLPDTSLYNQVFTVNSSGSTGWQTWNKPNNISYVNIFCLGSGGGGGGGRGNTNNSGTGGGGGGAAGLSTGLFPACLLPDILYISVGRGGSGGAGGATNTNGTAGTSGELSYVSVTPSTGSTSVLMLNGDSSPGGGGGGQSTNNGTAGSAGTAWSYSVNFIFPQLGQITPNAGQVGVLGGSTGPGVGGTITINGIVTAGAGGGGVSLGGSTANGGNITGVGIIPTGTGGTANSATIIEGAHGLGLNLPTRSSNSPLPMFFTGGAGGGAASTSGRIGGNGGNGSYGSGGGGGGAAYLAAGGNGGRGGDGLVIITCW
jgi:hypothetical protein